MRRFHVAVPAVLGVLAVLAAPAAGAKPPPRNDTTPPGVTIASPLAGTTVSGKVTVTGTASDNTSVAKVELRVDAGAYALVSGTSSWSGTVDAAAYPAGTHTLSARATDKAGNVAVKSQSLSFGAAPAPTPTPTPTPAPDTTAPTVAITSPAPSSTLAGSVNVAGTAADAGGLARVEVSLDGAPWSLATGTGTWAWSWNTVGSTDGSHTIAARAVDLAGNIAATQQTDVVQNAVSAPTLPAGVQDQLVTPEGATIQILDGVTGWTAQRVYDLLKPSAYELDRVGPDLLIKVQTAYASQTGSSATGTNGRYTAYHATIYLKAASGTTFTNAPDFVIAHEYGHAWTMYHYYLDRQADWSSYLAARGLAGDPRVDSTYNWSKTEMIADDYRMLFGSPAAVDGTSYINSQAPDPRTVPGLRDFFVSSWAMP